MLHDLWLEAQMSVPVGSPQILVVEDSRAVTLALAGLLAERGYEPVVFQKVAPALEYARKKTPAAALIDIHLPDGSGLDLVASLREVFGQSVPIIIISGDTSMEVLRALPGAGATYFFSKPVNAALLMERIDQWVSQRPAAST
jgi:DNA-binding response OmpR family regulator